MSSQERYTIVFNLFKAEEELYFPTAYIVKYNANEKLGYIQQKAVKETIGSFELENGKNPSLLRLLNIHEQVNPEKTATLFQPKDKKVKFLDLEALCKEPETAKKIKAYVSKKVDEWLLVVKNEQLPLCIDLPRKEEANRYLVNIKNPELRPELSFSLKPIGIEYQLQLWNKEKNIPLIELPIKTITQNPAWIQIGPQLYKVPYIQAPMLKPFLQKTHIYIPPKTASDYFEKFIVKVAAKADVKAEGFELIHSSNLEKCKLQLCRDVFTDEWVVQPLMEYEYNTHFIWSDERKNKTGLIHQPALKIVKITRNTEEENKYVSKLKDFGFEMNAGHSFYKKTNSKNPYHLMEWLIHHKEMLEQKGLFLDDLDSEDKKIYAHTAHIQFQKEGDSDWFDIYAVVHVGEFTIPFTKMVKYIKEKNTFYPLPNGTFFIIPEEWFTKYESFVKFGTINGTFFRFPKNQYTLLQELKLIEKEKKKTTFKQLDDILAQYLKADLRPYQKEGVVWMLDLYHKGLGACLADDMGLGKTLQTISVLTYVKHHLKEDLEKPIGGLNIQTDLFSEPPTSKPLRALIVMPSSLIFNWKKEIEQFSPSLKIYSHTGTLRSKKPEDIIRYDVVLSTYHTVARDVEILDKIAWEYVILDESQQIKNKDAKIFQAIKQLQSNHKLALSGTPIENSLSDLWSQMQFINPELLGSFNFFKNEFINPIERKNDEACKKKLYQLVGPYLLRRTKQQVAKDLPPLTQKIYYSTLTDAQEKLYEAEKSMVRNYLLNVYDEKNGQSKMHVLQSLTKLRQIANHPAMIDEAEIESGKMEDVLNHWKTVVKSGHKVLIFSSFVKYLEEFVKYFHLEQIPFAMLTGEQTLGQRKKEIERFESESAVKTFLISMKAGGVGLNLTQADYVFILDPWWNPFVEQQAIARAHRIGQDKQVMAIKFISKNTLEEKILLLQEKKSDLAEEIITESNKIGLNKQDLMSLLD